MKTSPMGSTSLKSQIDCLSEILSRQQNWHTGFPEWLDDCVRMLEDSQKHQLSELKGSQEVERELKEELGGLRARVAALEAAMNGSDSEARCNGNLDGPMNPDFKAEGYGDGESYDSEIDADGESYLDSEEEYT